MDRPIRKIKSIVGIVLVSVALVVILLWIVSRRTVSEAPHGVPAVPTGPTTPPIQESPPLPPPSHVSNNDPFAIDLDQDGMANIVLLLEGKYGVRIGFEDLDYREESDAITLGDIERKMEVLAKTQPLSPKEQLWSRNAHQLLQQGVNRQSLFDLNCWRQSGHFIAPTMDQLLDKVMKNSPYNWARRNGSYYIHPQKASVLDFPVSLDISDKSLPEVALALIAQAPSPKDIILSSNGSCDLSSVRVRRIVLNKIQAAEALFRIVEAASPTMCWCLAGYQGQRNLGFTPQQESDH